MKRMSVMHNKLVVSSNQHKIHSCRIHIYSTMDGRAVIFIPHFETAIKILSVETWSVHHKGITHRMHKIGIV